MTTAKISPRVPARHPRNGKAPEPLRQFRARDSIWGSASVANLRHPREARGSEAPEDYVELIADLIDPCGEARAEDSALIAEAGKQKQERTPVSGKAEQDLVEKLLKTPKEIVAIADQATELKK